MRKTRLILIVLAFVLVGIATTAQYATAWYWYTYTYHNYIPGRRTITLNTTTTIYTTFNSTHVTVTTTVSHYRTTTTWKVTVKPGQMVCNINCYNIPAVYVFINTYNIVITKVIRSTEICTDAVTYTTITAGDSLIEATIINAGSQTTLYIASTAITASTVVYDYTTIVTSTTTVPVSTLENYTTETSYTSGDTIYYVLVTTTTTSVVEPYYSASGTAYVPYVKYVPVKLVSTSAELYNPAEHEPLPGVTVVTPTGTDAGSLTSALSRPIGAEVVVFNYAVMAIAIIGLIGALVTKNRKFIYYVTAPALVALGLHVALALLGYFS